MDQFYDEEQFECYRALGYDVARSVFWSAAKQFGFVARTRPGIGAPQHRSRALNFRNAAPHPNSGAPKLIQAAFGRE